METSTNQLISTWSWGLLLIVSFLINIPLGYIREGCQKFSLKWIWWIHASIPVLIYLRIKFHIAAWFIPLSIAAAIVGQMLGSRLRQSRMTKEDHLKMEMIHDLKLPLLDQCGVRDEEVMVVLLNMGGPKTIAEVRPFLKRLFLDDLILRFPLSFLLQGLFANLIIAIRGKETEKRYQLIGGGSPIFQSTAAQSKALQALLKRQGRSIDVIFSFNYSDPLPHQTIAETKKAGKKYILPLSLYPHYSLATTGSNIHYLKKAAKTIYPELVFLKAQSYYLQDSYIQGFIDRIEQTLKPQESLDDFYLLFSTHGLPLYFLTDGDPYPYEISQTVAQILARLNRTTAWAISYQSAVGPLQWLKPSTEAVIEELAQQDIKKLLVVPVSFVTDHIETICEIDMEYREVAHKAGIRDFRMTRALECHPGFIEALSYSVTSSLGGKADKEKMVRLNKNQEVFK